MAQYRDSDRERRPADQPHYAEEFIIPAADEDGKSVRCQFRCSPRLQTWMKDIVDSRKLPFRRDADLMRYGLYVACSQVADIEPTIPSLRPIIDAANAAVRQRQDASMVVHHVDKLASYIEELRQKKAWGEIVRTIAEDRFRANKGLEAEPYWGQVWLDLLDDRLGHVEKLAHSKLEHVDWGQVLGLQSRSNGNGAGEGE